MNKVTPSSPDSEYRYDAFISYRHVEVDRAYAKWLHRALETYRVPKSLVAQGFPRRITRVFRDEEELPASPNLSNSIEEALESSRFLVVVCSPRIKDSVWCDAEVRNFRDLGRHDRIIALLIEGEPAESFLPSLCEIRHELVQQDGSRIEEIEAIEPLAADVRPNRQESQRELKHLAKLRILACILGCRFDDLRQREQSRRQRRMAAAGVILGMLSLVFLGLTAWALYERDLAGKAQLKAEAAEQDATEALDRNKIEGSRRLFEDGTRLMGKGLIEEGLATLVRSLQFWPENHSARERLLYELNYRRWMVPVKSTVIVPIPLVKNEERRSYDILQDGTLRVSYVETATAPEETSLRHIDGEWKATDPPEWVESEDDRGRINIGPLSITCEDIEGPSSHAEVVMKTAAKTITTFGLVAVHPSKKIVAVVGQLDGDSRESAYDDGFVHAAWYDTTTLEELGALSFSRPEDSDVAQLIWGEKRLHIVSQADNRDFLHLDIVDTGSAELLIHNNIIPAAEWHDSITYQLHYDDGQRDGGILWSFVDDQLISYTFPRFSAADMSIVRTTYGISKKPVIFAASKTELFVAAPSESDSDAIESHCQLTDETARLERQGITILDKDGKIIRKIRPKVLSGEGGRQLVDIAYSPQGRYLLVQGHSAGGGVDDWEVRNSEGHSVLPVCLPRTPLYYRSLPSVVAQHGGFTAARGWSLDGRFIIFRGLTSTTRRGIDERPDQSFQIVFCVTPPPPWFLDSVGQILKIKLLASGQFHPVQPRSSGEDTMHEDSSSQTLDADYRAFLRNLMPRD